MEGKMWEWFVKPTKESVKEDLVLIGKDIWGWFVESIPDMFGYMTMACGIFIILGPMIGRSGSLRPAGYLAAGFILSVCVLEAA